MDYAVVLRFDGDLLFDQGKNVLKNSQTTCGGHVRNAGVEHNVFNGNGFPAAFFEEELLKSSSAE